MLQQIIKQVGLNGQISLGKDYAGKQVQLSTLDDGSILIKKGKFIPDNEMWLYRGNNLEELRKAVEEAENTPRINNQEEMLAKLERMINEQ